MQFPKKKKMTVQAGFPQFSGFKRLFVFCITTKLQPFLTIFQEKEQYQIGQVFGHWKQQKSLPWIRKPFVKINTSPSNALALTVSHIENKS